ncbi:hypothetical protein VSS74_15250 [Conexibacter stalactiti]|uniref:DUF2157 domain-containing protein n=1 Tax=Conexibacter stalactiti TaxID=1940611 RepID=A0ABU4HQY5_9ACTN|nr:hypothetical protein [Conexibacter stalactiti]MDW5595705.1 hypothetical protein [Conexibacter stalactiti]MEC5036347.1 hypothetical protein [Conexibacter stalactiti]
MSAPSRLQRLSGPLLRSSDFGPLHETLLITAVATVLVIRTQLWLTNYPQLGGHGLHIAHLLWGGLFMLVAIGLSVTFLGRPVKRRVAIIGGVGFGFFIDELGKFVTSDNNYFYQPAAALIYLIFVGLFLLARWIQNRGLLTPRESLANAIELAGEATRHPFDDRTRARALELLDRSDPADPLVAPVRRLLEEIETIPAPPPSRVERQVRRASAAVHRFTARPSFPTVLTCVFAVWALLSFISAAELALALVVDLGGAHPGFVGDGFGNLHVANIASVTASFVAGVMVARGIVLVRRGGMDEAVRWFERALLVSILIGRVFDFYESQFGAVIGLLVDLLLLFFVRRLGAQTAGGAQRAESSAGPLPAPAV